MNYALKRCLAGLVVSMFLLCNFVAIFSQSPIIAFAQNSLDAETGLQVGFSGDGEEALDAQKPPVGVSSTSEDLLNALFTARGTQTGHRVLVSGSGFDRIDIIDYDGSSIWSLPQKDIGWAEVNDADLMPNGNVVFAVRMASKSFVQLVRPLYPQKTGYEVLWTYEIPTGAENHTAQALPDGGVLVAEAYSDYVRLIELDPLGNVRLIIGSKENKLENFNTAVGSHGQIRQAHKTLEGTYLLSHMSKAVTVEFDVDGQVLATYPAGGFTAAKDAEGNVIVAGGDAHTITCFSPDGTKLWQVGQTDISGVSLGFVASINVLENGNIVFANWGGHGGASGAAVMEVNPQTKELAWSLNCGSAVSNVQVLDTVIEGDEVFVPQKDPIVTDQGEAFRSPHDAVSSILTGLVYVADHTNKTIEVIRSATDQLILEIPVEQVPNALLLSPDGKHLFVGMGAENGEICEIDTGTHLVVRKIAVGHTPSAMALSTDGKTLFAANRFSGTLQTIALSNDGSIAGDTTANEPVWVGREPMAIQNNKGSLYIGNHLPVGTMQDDVVSSEVAVFNEKDLNEIARIKLVNGATNLKDMALSPDGAYLYVTHALGRYNVATTHADRGWIYTNAVTEINTKTNEVTASMLLDDLDEGAANPWGIAVSSHQLFISIAGTRELMVINRDGMRAKIDGIASGKQIEKGFLETTQDIANDLTFLTPFKTRIDLGQDGPRGLTLLGNKIYVANYYSGSISVYNLSTKKMETIILETTAEVTPQRQGEKLWNDATIGFQKWQSCASCHPDARADALNWDNLNDGIGTPKQARTMLDSWTRGRVMATGIRPNAKVAVRAGLKFIMFNAGFPEKEFEKIDAYVESLIPEVSPQLKNGQLTESASRGKALFEGEAGCAACHIGETKGQDKLVYANYTQGAETRGLLIPPLREVWRTAPYLHDGSAATIEDVLTTRNVSGTHGKVKALSGEQVTDISNYVLTIGTSSVKVGYTITGNVTTSLEDVSMEGIEVSLYAADDAGLKDGTGTKLGTALTQSDGSYTMQVMVEAGEYVLVVEAGSGYLPARQNITLATGSSIVPVPPLELVAPSPDTYIVNLMPGISDCTVDISKADDVSGGEVVTVIAVSNDKLHFVKSIRVETVSGATVPVSNKGNDVFEFTMPNSDVIVYVDMGLYQTLAEAKDAVNSALEKLIATNNTEAETILNAAKAVVTNPNITVSIVDASFVKKLAKVGTEGSVKAIACLALDTQQELLNVFKVIDALPRPTPPPDDDDDDDIWQEQPLVPPTVPQVPLVTSQPIAPTEEQEPEVPEEQPTVPTDPESKPQDQLPQTLEEALKAVQKVIEELVVTKDTTEQELFDTIQAVVTNPDIVVALSNYQNTLSDGKDGQLQANVLLAYDGVTQEFAINKTLATMADAPEDTGSSFLWIILLIILAAAGAAACWYYKKRAKEE